MRRIRGGRFPDVRVFLDVAGGSRNPDRWKEKKFLEGKKKGASKNAVYALDEVLEFCWRTTKKS